MLKGEQDIIVSVHAIEGKQDVNTIRLIGSYKDSQIMILVDSGGTNSFIDEKVAKILKQPLM